jgi:hypothetical protein
MSTSPVPYVQSLILDRIALALATGKDKGLLCAVYDLTPAAFASLQDTPEFKERLTAVRERLQLADQLNAHFVETLAPKAAQNVESVLNDPNNKQFAEMSWRVFERSLPQKHDHSGGLTASVDAQTVDRLAGFVEKLMAAKATQPPAPALEAHLHAPPAPKTGGSLFDEEG